MIQSATVASCVVHPGGFQPPTRRVEAGRSMQLSYGHESWLRETDSNGRPRAHEARALTLCAIPRSGATPRTRAVFSALRGRRITVNAWEANW